MSCPTCDPNDPSSPLTQRDDHPLGSAADASLRTLTTRQLFGTRQELLIEHAGAVYRLRITHANKLILTK